MTKLVVRNIEANLMIALQRRAKRNSRRIEDEVREIVRDAVAHDHASQAGGLGTEITLLFSNVGLDSEIEEFRSIQSELGS
jgi:plasmid stability protein